MPPLIDRVQPPPFRVPLLDTQGQLVEVWRRFFLTSQVALTQILAAKPSALAGTQQISIDDSNSFDDVFPPLTGGINGIASFSGVIDDTTTNATMYPVWVNATPGNEQLETSSTGLKWNPSINRLSIGTASLGSVSVAGQLALINTQLDNAVQTIAATVTMPAVITTTRSAFNFDITTAGSSSQITQGLVFTMEAGYTGSSAVKALLVQSNVATTGFEIGVTARMIGAAGVNIGVNAFCNAGTQNIALFGGLGNTDGSTFSSGISACLVLANGTTASDLIQGWNNVTKNFSVTGAGVLNAAGTIVSGNNMQCGASAFMTWNGRAAMASPADGQINFDKQSTTIGVGIDVTTDAVLKVRTRAQTGDASITALNASTSGTLIDTSYNIAVPVTLGTVTMSANQQRQIINPAATLAVLTVTLPPTPTDGQIAGISFTQIISALTINAPGGATVVQAPTSAAVDTNFRFIYQASSTSWFPAA